MPEKWILRQYQSLPLRAKVGMSETRIIEWYDHFNGEVCVSFSGGKDSTVLAHLVHKYYPDVPLVFANTGLEYPEIQAFARKMGAEFVRPKMRFDEVISKYGYPIISKENAEAIYYARRIKNSERERERGFTTDRKRNELVNRQRQATRANRVASGEPDEHVARHKRERERERVSLTHTGTTGEEEPLPG